MTLMPTDGYIYIYHLLTKQTVIQIGTNERLRRRLYRQRR